MSARSGLDRGFAALAGANPHDLLYRRHEDLAVADLAGACRLDDGLDGALDVTIRDDELDLDLGQEVDDVLGPAIKLGVALLAAEAFYLGNREAGHAHFGQRF